MRNKVVLSFFGYGQKEKGKFQHSSFLAGGVTTAAGRLLVQHGVLQVRQLGKRFSCRWWELHLELVHGSTHSLHLFDLGRLWRHIVGTIFQLRKTSEH
jgi:hypothetical protein